MSSIPHLQDGHVHGISHAHHTVHTFAYSSKDKVPHIEKHLASSGFKPVANKDPHDDKVGIKRYEHANGRSVRIHSDKANTEIMVTSKIDKNAPTGKKVSPKPKKSYSMYD